MIGLIRQSFSSSSKVAGIVMFLGLFLQVAFFFLLFTCDLYYYEKVFCANKCLLS